jgi:hypothetical protein
MVLAGAAGTRRGLPGRAAGGWAGEVRYDIYIYRGGALRMELVDPGTGAPATFAHRYLWDPAVDQILAVEDPAGDVLWGLADHQGAIRDVTKCNEARGQRIGDPKPYSIGIVPIRCVSSKTEEEIPANRFGPHGFETDKLTDAAVANNSKLARILRKANRRHIMSSHAPR